MAERVGKKGIVEISSFKTTDGKLHETMDAAETHQRIVDVNAKLAKHVKSGVVSITWGEDVPAGQFRYNGLYDREIIVTFKDGSVLTVCGAGGDETTHTEINLNGKGIE